MAEKHRSEVVIHGGGMVGMSMAIALASQHIPTIVIERNTLSDQLDDRFDGRVSAIALGSKYILEHIGTWDDMAAHAEPILDIRVSDGDMPFFLHYDHHEVGDEPFGYIVENRYIRYALHQAARKLPDLTILDNCHITDCDTSQPQHVTVTLSNGDSITCNLLIGADSKHSPIREMVGIACTQWGYDQTAIVCTITHDEPHQGLAQERFVRAGPFAALPMTDNRSSLVWVEPKDRVQLYLDLPEEEFVQEITERVGAHLGSIRCDGPRFSYPLSLMHAKQYTHGRVVLIGDAAHSIHPLAGQGVNLGFRDVAVLYDLLGEQHKLGLDIGSPDVLKHYQRWRRFDNVTMMAVTDNLNRFFAYDVLPIKLMRGIGLWGVNQCPPLKRFLMRHAMGLVGDLPEIVKKSAKI